jgi:hypothetical protein
MIKRNKKFSWPKKKQKIMGHVTRFFFSIGVGLLCATLSHALEFALLSLVLGMPCVEKTSLRFFTDIMITAILIILIPGPVTAKGLVKMVIAQSSINIATQLFANNSCEILDEECTTWMGIYFCERHRLGIVVSLLIYFLMFSCYLLVLL